MSTQKLMCVWQAIHAGSNNSTSPPSKDEVLLITASFSQNQMVHFSHQEFQEAFPSERIDYNEYVQFVKTKMAFSLGTCHLVEDAIDGISWDLCMRNYKHRGITIEEDELRKLWEMNNRLCLAGSYPPVTNKDETLWLGEKLSTALGQHWTYKDVPNKVTFLELMELLIDKCLCKASPSAVSKAIDDLYNWLVKEIILTGWLFKRTRKQANWTSWLRRWFVLTPRRLAYYDGSKQKEKKGEVLLTSYSKVEELDDYRSLARRFPHRLRIVNAPYLELDLSAKDAHERVAWKDAIVDVITASREGITPVQAVINERRSRNCCDLGKHEIKTIETGVSQIKVIESTKKQSDSPVVLRRRSQKRPSFPQLVPLAVEDKNIQSHIEKIQDVFRKVDKTGKGSVDGEQFKAFIRSLGLKISDEEIDNIFSNIEVSKDGVITFDEFLQYFVHNVLDEKGGKSSKAEGSLRTAFMRADRDGTGTLDFREFAEYLWEKRRSTRLSKIINVFDAMHNGQGEVSFEQFRQFFQDQRLSLISEVADEADEGHRSPTLEDHLRTMYKEADAEKMATYLRDRWDVFASFKRPGESGKMAMHGGHGMVADVLPGMYNLVDLACFTDLPPITPRYAVVPEFQWISAGPGSCHGQAIFPEGFDGVLPVEIATTEHLRYYGGSLADSTQVQISLMYRHGIQDFTYMNQYLEDYVKTANGGAGIETHEFSHLDCPLENDSGYFIIGKVVEDVLHLTAFYVPVRHSVYIPGGTIHSNDYLKGTWRTMLSDEADIDHVHLMRRNATGAGGMEHFTFSFQPI